MLERRCSKCLLTHNLHHIVMHTVILISFKAMDQFSLQQGPPRWMLLSKPSYSLLWHPQARQGQKHLKPEALPRQKQVMPFMKGGSGTTTSYGKMKKKWKSMSTVVLPRVTPKPQPTTPAPAVSMSTVSIPPPQVRHLHCQHLHVQAHASRKVQM
jgi:hypothetical protein